ncbi:MAG: hypothetical protein ACE5G2_08140 [Candidatus Krumholzibacteriia bacterium]
MGKRWWMCCGALLAVLLLSGCGREQSELLVVYSADCQAFLEPCG